LRHRPPHIAENFQSMTAAPLAKGAADLLSTVPTALLAMRSGTEAARLELSGGVTCRKHRSPAGSRFAISSRFATYVMQNGKTLSGCRV
jgi:hypothetical protein